MPKAWVQVFLNARSTSDPYRVYFGKDGDSLVLLLAGGTKQRQQNDIRHAIERWDDYKSRKKLGNEKDGE